MAVLSNVRKLSSRKVAIYVRVSTHWQIDKDSLKVQEKELIVYCEMILGTLATLQKIRTVRNIRR